MCDKTTGELLNTNRLNLTLLHPAPNQETTSAWSQKLVPSPITRPHKSSKVNISSSLAKIRLHTENQLPSLPASALFWLF